LRLPESEAALVKLAARCNDAAFSALVERHRLLLRLTAKRFGETREDQEDLTQEVIARLLDRQKKALQDWRPVAPFAAYLTTIASRRGIRFAQERSRLPGRGPMALPEARDPIEDGVIPGAVAPPSDSPHHHLESAERAELVRRAVEQLSDRDRLLIRLRFFEGLDAVSISRVLGLSHGAARKAVFDALRRLERLLDSQADLVFPGW